jgi:hypothetical protein
LVGKGLRKRIGNMLAEIKKKSAQSCDHSAVFSHRQQPLVKRLLQGAVTNPRLTIFSFKSGHHHKLNAFSRSLEFLQSKNFGLSKMIQSG